MKIIFMRPLCPLCSLGELVLLVATIQTKFNHKVNKEHTKDLLNLKCSALEDFHTPTLNSE